MIEIALGVLSSILTEIGKKYGINGNLLILILSITIGVSFVIIEYTSPASIEYSYKTLLSIYGTSQIIYNYLINQLKTNK